jgi:hypothetical protein
MNKLWILVYQDAEDTRLVHVKRYSQLKYAENGAELLSLTARFLPLAIKEIEWSPGENLSV